MFHSTIFRIIFIVIIAVLPINLMTIAFSTMIVKNSQEQLDKEIHQNRYDFYVKTGNQTITVAENVDGTHLGSEAAGGFVGAYAGLFATANGSRSDHKAWFSYFVLGRHTDSFSHVFIFMLCP